jgi:BirA family transcriptional regulator, biotin operon repressor / biotin---[acetyl-CoA-carboxylase] ligase
MSFEEENQLKEEVLSILKTNPGVYISGQSMCEKLNVSRTAIWKYINALKEEGYAIESVSKKGYRLISSPDLLTCDEVCPFLNTKYIGRNYLHFDTLESTNSRAKELASKPGMNGAVVVSEEQTTGKGRLGRHWVSPKHRGIWMSVILKPDIEPSSVPRIVHIAAAAVVLAMKETGIEPYVKWPNDIILNGKKVCGILTEMSGEINHIDFVVVGIGINANLEPDDIPADMKEKASSIYMETGVTIERKGLAAKVLNHFEHLYEDFLLTGSIDASVKICRENSILLGKEIRIISRQKELKARAVDISDGGELIVQFEDGRIEPIVSGEVSVRGMNGYV